MKPFDLLVFDWDGTLMDSEYRIVTCMQKAMADVGEEPQPSDEVKQIIGLGLVEAVTQLYPGASESFIEDIANAYRKHFLFEDKTPSPMFEGAVEVLQTLNAEGYLMAVATGKSRRGLDRVFGETGLGDLFHVSRCADETRSKPHPLMLEEILTDMDTEAHRAVMIGDTEFDLHMAMNAKMPCIGVDYGVHDAARLQSCNPLTLLSDIRDLPQFLTDST